MVSKTGVLTQDELKNLVRERAKDYSIPDTGLEIDVYRDNSRQEKVVQVYFRSLGKIEKYKAEIVVTVKPNQQTNMDLIKRKIDHMLVSLEQCWLEEGGKITFYKGHGFFYRCKRGVDTACLEVQCTVCNHAEMVNQSADMLDKYCDVFLMKLLPEAHAKCDCAEGRYDVSI